MKRETKVTMLLVLNKKDIFHNNHTTLFTKKSNKSRIKHFSYHKLRLFQYLKIILRFMLEFNNEKEVLYHIKIPATRSVRALYDLNSDFQVV